MFMFCIVTVVRIHVLYCDCGTCTCFVLWQWYVYMFCIVTVVRVHVLYCDSGTCTCFVLSQWYVYIFVLWLRYVRKKVSKHWTKRSFRDSSFIISFLAVRSMSRAVCRSSSVETEIYSTEKYVLWILFVTFYWYLWWLFCSAAAIVLAPEVCIPMYCVWRAGGTTRGAVPHRVLHAAFVYIFAQLLRNRANVCTCCNGKLIPEVPQPPHDWISSSSLDAVH